MEGKAEDEEFNNKSEKDGQHKEAKGGESEMSERKPLNIASPQAKK